MRAEQAAAHAVPVGTGVHTAPRVERWGWVWPRWNDPRIPFAAILTLYGVLGFSFFGFNRSPWQMAAIVVSGSVLDAGMMAEPRITSEEAPRHEHRRKREGAGQALRANPTRLLARSSRRTAARSSRASTFDCGGA